VEINSFYVGIGMGNLKKTNQVTTIKIGILHQNYRSQIYLQSNAAS